MSLTDITPASLKIQKIMQKVESGDIKVPAFQRGFVWKQDQVIDILDSIYNDYPIGSILLWNSRERLRSTRNIGGFLIPETEPEYPVNYVLDGQQRLSSIYAVFCENREQAPDNKQYNLDTKIFDIYFDFNEKKFIHKEDLQENHVTISMNDLLITDKLFKIFNRLPKEYQSEVQKLHEKFNNYEIPIVTIGKKNKDEVGVIFERINSTGTKLTTLDLMVAWTWSDDFHLREEIDTILSILEQKNFEDTPDKIILQCLGSIIKKSTSTKEILGLEPDSVKQNIDLLTRSLERTIDFLSTELNIKSRDFLPHSHQIVPLTYFFSNIKTPNIYQSTTIKQWFWKTSFSRRYSGSTDKKMNEDITFFDKVLSGDNLGINRYFYAINKSDLIEQQFSKSNPYTRAFLLLLAQKNPLNIANGNKIDLGRALSQYNLREYHHIFPKSFLKKNEVNINKINSLCNFTFLPATSNKEISNKAPADYIFNITPPNKFAEILDSNLMPKSKEIYSKNEYDDFLQRRAEIIIEFLDGLLA